MKKVLQVVSCLEFGGTEAFIMNNYRVLDKQEYQFDFLIFLEKEYGYEEEIEKMGGKIFFSGLPSLKQIHKFLKRVNGVIKENGPYSAVHSHVNLGNSWVLYAAAKAGVPVRVSHSHDTSGKGGNFAAKVYSRIKIKMIKKYATHILACSEMAGEYLYGKKFFADNGKVIPNGIDLPKYLKVDRNAIEKRRREFEIPLECDLIVGNITRFEAKKNQMFILEVFKYILRKNPKAILLLGGPDGGQLSDVINKADQLRIRENIRFIGKRTDVPACLKLIDIYLFPSLYEGLAFSILEAQAAGCFCISSDEVSHESDMGIESLTFISLEKSSVEWADIILRLKELFVKPSDEVIKRCFTERGFEIYKAHQNLLNVYNGENGKK